MAVNIPSANPQTSAPPNARVPDNFLSGGGEMGARIRDFDWSQTALGGIADWPAELRHAVQICVESKHPIVLYWGADFLLLYNDAWSPVLGGKHPGALGRSAREVWAEIRDEFGVLLESVFATGVATWCGDQFLPLVRHGFAEETYFSYSLSPVRAESGVVSGIFTAVTETTTRFIGERRLRTLRELSERTVEARTEHEVLEVAARVFEANPYDVPFSLLYHIGADRAELKACHGLSDSQAAGLGNTDLEGNADLPLAAAVREGPTLITTLGQGDGKMPGGVWPEESRNALILPIGDGQIVDHALVAGISPRRPFNENYRTFLELLAAHVGTGLSRARAFEAERKRAQALAEIDRAKTAFFSNVSHEFRTPLTLTLGPLESVMSTPGAATPAALEEIRKAHRNSLRLLKLVNTLLDFSRIEAGRAKACYAPVDLAALTGDLASNFRSLMESSGLEFVINCEPLSQPVYVDGEMWEKILLNLLSNAFKFTFEGRVTVKLEAIGEQAVLTVADTGTGIPQAELPRIFERFHRVEGARGRSYEGTGIGLALIEELVKLHGGTVSVRSQPGEGSAFSVALPFGSAHLPPERIGQDLSQQVPTGIRAEAFISEARNWVAREQRVAASPCSAFPPFLLQPGARPKILLVEDNADMGEHLLHLLASQYQATVVENGIAALNAARRDKPDLILTDVMMPGLDGFGLLREVRADKQLRDVPVVLLSARAGEEARIEGITAGADDYVTKPFSAKELIARVRNALDLQRLRADAREALRVSENRQAFLLKLSDALRAAGTPEMILEAALRIIAEEFQADLVLYGESTPNGDAIEITDCSIRSGLPKMTGRFPLSNYGTKILATGKTLVISDVKAEAQLSPTEIAGMVAAGAAATITIPLVKNGRWVSVLGVHHGSPRAWSGVDIQLLEESAERTWAAVERARAETDLARELEGTHRLQAISGLLIKDEDSEKLFNEIVDTAIAVMRADFGSLQVLDPDDDELHLLAWRNFHPESAEFWQKVSVKSGSVCGASLQHGERIVVPDVCAAHSLVHPETLRHHLLSGIRAVQSTPLTSREGAVLGMISTHWREVHTPSERELRLLDVLVREAADFLERRRAQEEAKQAHERRLLLMGELNHRVKNTLATVQSIANQTLRGTADPAQFVEKFKARIQALSRAHNLLTGSGWEATDVTEIVRDQLFMDGGAERITLAGPRALLAPQAALAFALVMHELGTNARKYGALSVPNGRLTVQWTNESPEPVLQLLWAESGGPTVREPERRGFGTALIEKSLGGVAGSTKLYFDAAGLRCSIRLPLAPDGSSSAVSNAI